MKKLLALLLAVLMVFSLTACGKKKDKDSDDETLFNTQGLKNKDDSESGKYAEYSVDEEYKDDDDDDYYYQNDSTLPSTSTSSSIEEYIEANKTQLLSTMESSFANSSGMTCRSDINVRGNGFVIDIYINELNNIDSSIKEQMQAAYDGMDSQFDSMLTALKMEVPGIEYFTINVRETDGDIIATITAN